MAWCPGRFNLAQNLGLGLKALGFGLGFRVLVTGLGTQGFRGEDAGLWGCMILGLGILGFGG